MFVITISGPTGKYFPIDDKRILLITIKQIITNEGSERIPKYFCIILVKFTNREMDIRFSDVDQIACTILTKQNYIRFQINRKKPNTDLSSFWQESFHRYLYAHYI